MQPGRRGWQSEKAGFAFHGSNQALGCHDEPERSAPESPPTYYDEAYFSWQAPLGEFGGWANQAKFDGHIAANSTVLDFGCGGGFLLKNVACGKRVGVELNPVAADTAKKNGIEVYRTVDEVPDRYVDLVISNNALEHTLYPLQELKALHKKLRVGGRMVFVVPCESISYAYQPNDHITSTAGVPCALGISLPKRDSS
ncbi:MAG TPA: class I SAM-dependent methyltransferase [Nitrospira sp.]|nr:class I SAM-dependent methyltransferase [Nitrospira sp.]